MFVYVIVCNESLKIYIGQHSGTSLQHYLQQKWSDAHGRRREGSSHLYNAMRKYPRESWSIHPLVSGIESKAELDETEQLLIYALKAQHPNVGYNICDGGEGFTGPHSELSKQLVSASLKTFYQSSESEATRERLREVVCERQERGEFIGRPEGYNHTPESIEKMSQKANERLQTEAGQAQFAACQIASKSPEALAKLSAANTGKPSPMKGIPRTEEVKEKLRIANTGKHHSNETRQKLSEVLRGRPGRHTGIPVSDETKQKISDALRARAATGIPNAFQGHQHSEESKQKIRGSIARGKAEGRIKSQAGGVVSEEAKQHMRDARRRAIAEGRVPSQVGKIFSEETRRKMSEAAKRRRASVPATPPNLE